MGIGNGKRTAEYHVQTVHYNTDQLRDDDRDIDEASQFLSDFSMLPITWIPSCPGRPYGWLPSAFSLCSAEDDRDFSRALASYSNLLSNSRQTFARPTCAITKHQHPPIPSGHVAITPGVSMTEPKDAGLSPALVETVAGLSAGSMATLIVHPLDIVKTRMQSVSLLALFTPNAN